MADPTGVNSPHDQDPNSTTYASEFDSLQFPPLESIFFSDADHNVANDPFNYSTALDLGFELNEDSELTFDDLYDLDDPYIHSDVAEGAGVRVCNSEASPGLGSSAVSCENYPHDCKFLDCELPIAGNGCYSTDSVGLNSMDSRVVNFHSPDRDGGSDHELSCEPASFTRSSGSGNFSKVTNCPASNEEHSDVIVYQKITSEEMGKSCMTKRKQDLDEGNADLRSAKYRMASRPAESTNPQLTSCSINADEEKRKERLTKNRESAQLSRLRKKHYVEDLEGKVRTMHSTIAVLNNKLSYLMAENAGLRQQLSGSGMSQPPPPGMYPHPAVASMPYPPVPYQPYVFKPQGSQTPLVPIPRLKPRKPAPVTRGKQNESRNVKGRTKKVASVSFLGLLFFIMLIGCLVPVLNVRCGNIGGFSSKLAFLSDRSYNQSRGRVLKVDRYSNFSDGVNVGTPCGKASSCNYLQCERIHRKKRELKFDRRQKVSRYVHNLDEPIKLGNASEPLVASLYVPRNDKLMKIDGNLIIRSFLASEKAMASNKAFDKDKVRETGLANPRHLSPALTISNIRENVGKHPNVYRKSALQPKALTPDSTNIVKNPIKGTANDGKLQQWFREDLAEPMLSSGLCTELFQFDVSRTSPGAIIPASSIVNTSGTHRKIATHLNNGGNRRILGGLPVPLSGSNFNITEEPVGNRRNDSFPGTNKTSSSMIVSLLIDPREAGNSEVDDVITPKSISRIFVVVLLDNVKYVTHSCVLPSPGSHVVSA